MTDLDAKIHLSVEWCFLKPNWLQVVVKNGSKTAEIQSTNIFDLGVTIGL